MQISNFLFDGNGTKAASGDKRIQFSNGQACIMAGLLPLGTRFLQFVAIAWDWTACSITLIMCDAKLQIGELDEEVFNARHGGRRSVGLPRHGAGSA
jgi:hypothetical protein